MDHLVEVAADQVGDIAEDRQRHGVHRGDAEVVVDEVYPERRFVEQRLELRARLVGAPMHLGRFHQRADAHQQLARAERLHQVVVGAPAETFDARFFAGARREENHRNRAQLRIRAQLADEPEPVEVRHHHVGDDEIGSARARGLERGLAVGDDLHVVVLGEQPPRVLAQVGVVVRQQDALRAMRPVGARRRLAFRAASPALRRRRRRRAKRSRRRLRAAP